MAYFLRNLFLLGFILSIPSALFAQSPLLRINAGGAEASSEGTTFISDTYFSDSKTAVITLESDVSGTEADVLFESERISPDDLSPFSYSIPVPDGNYTVSLHFAETTFKNEAKRLFNVEVEGDAVLEDYDIFTASGGQNVSIVETIPNVSVNDGSLDITFISELERAKVNAIEIFGSTNTVSIPFAVNAGDSLDYTAGSLTFSAAANSFFLDGQTFTGTGEIDNTIDDALFLSEIFGNELRFVLPGMQEGRYTVQLYFVETFHTGAGQRVFDISVEGEIVRPNYDIFSVSGGQNQAVIEIIDDVTVSDGILNVTLLKSASSAKINGIAVTNFSPVANEDVAGLDLPGTHKLSPAFPNPFNPQTNFSLTISQTQQVALNVYNVLGQNVAELFSGVLSGGREHDFQFQASDLPSGIYLIQAQGEHFVQTQQVVLMK